MTEASTTRVHGAVRGLIYVDRSSTSDSRFGRMFRWLPGVTYKADDLANLAWAMVQLEGSHARKHPAEDATPPQHDPFKGGPDIVFDTPAAGEFLDTLYGEPEPGDENPTIPAGYTYLGQFIDHDLTFDPNSSLEKQNDPDATVNFRVPRLDLDSVYGRGPDDQPYMYESNDPTDAGVKFLLGVKADGTSRPGELARNPQGRALTGDPRNDENNIVCQLHALILNFHNKVVDTLREQQKLTGKDLFVTAQQIVRRHYQYIVMNDYLPRIVGPETWNDVFIGSGSADLPRPDLAVYHPKNGQAYIPVEFSVAAFRFGHSMVRPSYALRRGLVPVGGGTNAGDHIVDPRFHRIPIFSDAPDPNRGASLDGFGPLHAFWEIDWRMFFSSGDMPTIVTPGGPDAGALGIAPQTAQQQTQPSYRIDSKLVGPLAMLPPNVANDGFPALAFRNLLRGSAFTLPSGQSVARAFGIEPLTEAELWDGVAGNGFDFSNPDTNPFHLHAPLWYYILREAERTKRTGFEQDTLGGHHLGPVGGRIVVEVLVGIMVSDHQSYLVQDPAWHPAKEKDVTGFDAGAPITNMFELASWATGGTMSF